MVVDGGRYRQFVGSSSGVLCLLSYNFDVNG